MKHLYKASIWQASSGVWYVNDTNDLAGIAGFWWIPCCLLEIEPVAYVKMLVDDFNVTHMHYNADKNVLLFFWDNYNDAHRYQLFINRKAREKNFIV